MTLVVFFGQLEERDLCFVNPVNETLPETCEVFLVDCVQNVIV
jgi:hypothetical protein